MKRRKFGIIDNESNKKGDAFMTDKEFNDAFTSAGGWFLLSQFEEIYTWKGSHSDLVDKMLLQGFDSKITGANTRVSSVLRIINSNASKLALEKCRDSKNINRKHPEAHKLASHLLDFFNL